MNRLSRDQIRRHFKAASAPEDTLFTRALAELSLAISDLRAEGIDVELMLTGCASEQGFQFDVGNNVAAWAQETSGILRIGNSQHLVALCHRVKLKSDGADAEWIDTVLMAVSTVDIRLQGPRQDIRTEIFHLYQDQDGVKELQEFIIAKTTTDQTIATADTHHSFSQSRQINLGFLDRGLHIPKLVLSAKPERKT